MRTVVVREHARLTTDHVAPSLDQATVSTSAFEWLCALSARFRATGAALLQVENRCWLRLDSHVGVIETPCGTVLEILPKHTPSDSEDAAESSRRLLIRMLASALDLPVRTAEAAAIAMFRHSLLEWVMQQFVSALDHLVKRGLRFDYQRVEEEERYVRGQLDTVRQMRQAPGRAHVFPIRHDLFLPDRPENRLLKSALALVCATTARADTWRTARELAGMLADLPHSSDLQRDFRAWRDDRLMAHYRPIKPWCELVLGQHMPLTVRGAVNGISLLFPMERLFERYVEVSLPKQLPLRYTLKRQARRASLCRHDGAEMFQLRPDLLLCDGNRNVLVMDAKWKLLDAADNAGKYGLSQQDLYQMFAYGHKYLDGTGDLVLVYPKTQHFGRILPRFSYSADLHLWVTPFDLEAGRLDMPPDLMQSGVEVLRADVGDPTG